TLPPPKEPEGHEGLGRASFHGDEGDEQEEARQRERPARARTRSRSWGSGKSWPARAKAAGATRAAPAPWTNLATRSTHKPGDQSPAREARPKTTKPSVKARRWPHASASRPPRTSKPLKVSPYPALTKVKNVVFTASSVWIAGR